MQESKSAPNPSSKISSTQVTTPTSPVSIATLADAPASPTPLLDKIGSPGDLKTLTTEELEILCKELRHELISTVSQIGGHFASSLGAVELTVALHASFNTPYDRLVWDTGHQAYIHKILTGRREALPKIRQFGGISGFPRRPESEYDTFGVAHAGTSISAALGMIESNYHGADKGEQSTSPERYAVAIIGDGAMTSGMAFEALNHAGHLHRRLIVILNDNEMSIAPNVGALSWVFSRAVTNRFSTTARKTFKDLVKRGLIPRAFYRFLDRAEEATQGFFSTPAMLFESFGFRYFGPVDGHNMGQLMHALKTAKNQDGPVLIHARTVKGKGYEPAEDDPVKWHGVVPFEVQNGKFIKGNSQPKGPSYTAVFGSTLLEICKSNPKVVGITAAMPDGTGLTLLQNEMPERYFDVGIAEQHAVTFAAGLACEGIVPVCAIYSTFLQRAYDQISHDVCLQSLPVIFAMDRGGLVGADGPTHHGVFDIAYLRSLPNMTVMAPKDEGELRDMLYSAVEHKSGPISIRYPRGNGVGADLTQPPKKIPIGKGELLREAKPSEKTLALIGFGLTVQFAMEAADRLAELGFECDVINARFAKPLDERLLERVLAKHHLAVSIEDHVIQGGFGSAVLEFMSDVGLTSTCRLLRMGIDDTFIEHGTQEELYRLSGFDVESIVRRVEQAFYEAERHPSRRAANL